MKYGLLLPENAANLVVSSEYNYCHWILLVKHDQCFLCPTTVASLFTSLTIVYSIVYTGADKRKHQSSASLAFVWGIPRWPVNFPHKWLVTRKLFPFDDVIMQSQGDVFVKVNIRNANLVGQHHPCSIAEESLLKQTKLENIISPPYFVTGYVSLSREFTLSK